MYGFNTITEVLKKIKSGTLYIQNSKNKNLILDILKRAEELNITIDYKDKSFFNSTLQGKNHQGLALQTDEEYLSIFDEKALLKKIDSLNKSNVIIVILDGITDVGNFGAILRSSVLFGVDFVVLPKNNSVPINSVAISHSAGAIFKINISYINNLNRFIGDLKKNNFWIYALDKQGIDITKVSFTDRTALIFGNEHRGLRPLVKKNCDQILNIPTNNKLDSLNVSVSVGVTLFEVSKSF